MKEIMMYSLQWRVRNFQGGAAKVFKLQKSIKNAFLYEKMKILVSKLSLKTFSVAFFIPGCGARPPLPHLDTALPYNSAPPQTILPRTLILHN